MSETWILFGEWFRLPLAVEWPDNRQVARVGAHPDIALLCCQRAVLEERLGAVGFSQDGSWFLTAQTLNEVACPSSAPPEEVVWWAPQQTVYSLPVSEESLDMPEGGLERRKFLSAFVNAFGWTVFETLEELEVFYLALCNFMASWVLEKNQAVDLVWAKVFAAPFWPGWEQRVDQARRGHSHKRQVVPGAKKLNDLLANALYNPELRKADAWGRIERRWPVLCPTDAWMKMSIRGEELRRRYMREARYVDLIDNRLKAMLPHLIEAYQKYRTGRDFSTVPRVFGNHAFGPGTGKVRHKNRSKRRVLPGNLARLLQHNAERASAKRAGQPGIAGSAAEGVPGVPDLPRQAADLRDGGAVVEQPGDRAAGDQGLLVQSRCEEKVPGGALLEPGAGERDGVGG